MGVRRIIQGACDQARGLVERVWYGDIPSSWFKPEHLAEWLALHQWWESGVWAAYRVDRTWEVYPPASPNPSQWPQGQHPYDRGPYTVFTMPDGQDWNIPLSAEGERWLLGCIERAAGGRVVAWSEGFRNARIDDSDQFGEVVFARVARGAR